MAAIVGIGMITAVGLSARETSASVRAGIVRYREGDTQAADGSAFITATVPTAGSDGWNARAVPANVSARDARLLRLAAAAIRDAALGGAPHAPLFLGIADTALTDADLLQTLAAMTGDAVDPRASRVVRGGREAGSTALALAIASGCGAAIAGGVDTLIDPEAITALAADGRAKCDACPDGFVPGEGAGFLALAPVGSAGIVADLVGAACAPALALAEAMRAAFSDGDAPVDRVYASMNGERRWAMEWAIARSRLSERFDSQVELHHPAESYGDIGAASGPVMVGLAALSGGARRTMIYASGDRGDHAVLLLSGTES